MAESVCCIVCGASSATPLFSQVPDYFLPTGIRVDYARCNACGLVQQIPLPTDVGPFYAGYPVHARKAWLHEVMRRVVMRPVYYDLATLNKDQVLLDYGCGDGWFLRDAAPHVSAAYGFEPTAAQSEDVSRRVSTTVFHDLAAMQAVLAGRVDVVTMHFVMEHLTDLRGTLRVISGLLKPGGVLRAVVPNLENVEFRWFGSRWHGFDAPRHICFPNPQQLAPILEEVGLSLQRDGYVPFPNTMAASLCIALTGRYRPMPFLFFLPLALIWARLYPRGNRVFVLQKL